jgi:glycosyltransferase involved in cell wall biosynthesis
MRICIDVSPAVHHRAGLGRYAQELTAALLDVDQENEYVGFYHHPSDARVDPALQRLPHLTTNLSTKPWRMSALLAHLARFPQDRLFPGVDLFHATDHLLPRLSRVKSVFTLHDLIFRFYPEAHKPLNRWFLTLMMPRFLQAADAVIAVSECTRRDAMRLYGLDEAKITVVYEGVNPRFRAAPPGAVTSARQKYGLPNSFMLSLGTIEPRKNLTLLLEAYHALRMQGTECGLVIVGTKGWLYEGFFRRLRELGLEDEVIFPGFVPEEDLPAVYSGADLFVFPSLYEGFGLPVLEAMACGTPVVCSNTSSLPEIVGDAAIMLDPLDRAAWISAMTAVLDSRALRGDMKEKGLQRAKRFSWEETAKKTVDVYRHVLSR